MKDLDLYNEELCKRTIVDLDKLKTKKVKCNCGYVFNCVGKRILCPRCKRIFIVK
ncbi:hypothetical protein [Methanothermococcus sp.]|uniref:hypothetical protein n=1 Tax=Methanothermococcus sp. TaxID=2614238 RepID=UPI0025E6010C|nr:hypothetical protein [Methanothermococcus sp.]